PNGKVSFVNTRLTGRIWGGDTQDMQIVSGDTLTQPTTNGGSTIAGVTEVGVPEPANIVLLGAALAALGGLGGVRRLLRKKQPVRPPLTAKPCVTGGGTGPGARCFRSGLP